MDTLWQLPPQQRFSRTTPAGSIVNLMATIAAALGARDGLYPRLRDPGSRRCCCGTGSRIVLMVVDGLGASHLTRYKDSALPPASYSDR